MTPQAYITCIGIGRCTATNSELSRVVCNYFAFVFTRPLAATMAMNVDAKLLRQTKFPPEFSRKVDMTKVNIEVMKK